MNLYKFHSDPKSLKHHGTSHETVPFLKWEQLVGPIAINEIGYFDDIDLDGVNIDEVKKYEHLWARDAKLSVLYATKIIKNPFPAGEKAISTNAHYSYEYARYSLKRNPFPAGEKVIATSAIFSYQYARYILGKKRFPAGEKAIATNVVYSYLYATEVIGKRFPAGEKVITTSSLVSYRHKYEEYFNIKL